MFTSLLSRTLHFSYAHSIMTHGVIYYVHMKELGQCFCFLCFVGFIIKCIYDTVIWCLYYICIMTSSISYRFDFDLVWIDRMNEWMEGRTDRQTNERGKQGIMIWFLAEARDFFYFKLPIPDQGPSQPLFQ